MIKNIFDNTRLSLTKTFYMFKSFIFYFTHVQSFEFDRKTIENIPKVHNDTDLLQNIVWRAQPKNPWETRKYVFIISNFFNICSFDLMGNTRG